MQNSTVLIGCVALFALLIAGCSSTPEPPGAAADGKDLAATALNHSVRNYAFLWLQRVEGAANRIALQTDDVEIRRRTVLWKIGTQTNCEMALQLEDARYALLQLWTNTLQTRNYLQKPGAESFGESGNRIALETMEELIGVINRLAEEFLPKETFAKARSEVEKFAKGNPVLKIGPRAVADGHDGLLPKLLSFSWIEKITQPLDIGSGVADTAVSISEVARSLDKATVMASGLPQMARWQTELLLYDLDENETVKQLRQNLDETSRNITLVAETAQRLPEEIRQQVSKVLREVEEGQGEIRKTLAETRLLLSDAKGTVTAVNEALAKADGVAGNLEKMTDSLAAAGAAWKPTLAELRAITGDATPPAGSGGKPGEPGKEDSGPNADIANLVLVADGLRDSAVELKGLLSEFRSTLQSGEIEHAVDEVDDTARGTVDHATARMEDVVDHAMWRGLLLAVGIAVIAFGYRFAANRILPKCTRKGTA